MNKNNNKMDLLGNAPVPQALMALGIPIMITSLDKGTQPFVVCDG